MPARKRGAAFDEQRFVELHVRLQEYAVENRPAGYALLARFLLEIEFQQQPLTETGQKLAVAFEQILNGLDAADALGLSRKRGERQTRNASRRAEEIVGFIAARLDKERRRGALQAAIAAAARKFSRSTSAIERTWRKYEGPYHEQKRAEAQALAEFAGVQIGRSRRG